MFKSNSQWPRPCRYTHHSGGVKLINWSTFGKVYQCQAKSYDIPLEANFVYIQWPWPSTLMVHTKDVFIKPLCKGCMHLKPTPITEEWGLELWGVGGGESCRRKERTVFHRLYMYHGATFLSLNLQTLMHFAFDQRLDSFEQF